MRTVFTSNVSFQEAMMKAQASGFRVVGQAQNKSGQFVVFGERIERTTNPRWFQDRNIMRGKI